MTDEQIIKALECCKAKKDPNIGVYISAEDILDLINRYKKDSATDNRIIALQDMTIAQLKAEIERCKKENSENFDKWKMLADKTEKHYSTLYEEAKEILKSEAIKEFAERLKARATGMLLMGERFSTVDTDDIDNLLKEMEQRK